jgi:hypothetical protein
MQKETLEEITIPIAVLKANFSMEGYFKRVTFIYRSTGNWCAAWQQIEEELSRYNLPERYTSYQSFISCRSRYVKSFAEATK